jgi:hypothetical protein
MIRVGECYLVDSKMLFLILQPFHGESPQKKLLVSIQSETDYRSALASPEDTGVLEREGHVSNYEFKPVAKIS